MSPQRIAAVMHTAPWLVGLSMLGLALAVVVYTGHTPRLVSVGVFALALVALLLYPRRLTPWLIGTAVLGLALVLLFYRLGDGSLHDFDEAIYAQATKEMLHLHVWGTPYWNGSLFLHKPPLYFWLTALTYQLLGVNEFAARFWSALFGFGVIGLTFVLGVRIRSWAVGAGAVLLLFGVIHKAYGHDFNFMSQARVGMLDVPLTFWVVGALVLILEAEKRPRLIMLIGIPAGLAVMTKAWPGGFALVIPLVYWLFTRRGGPHYISYWLIAGLLASAIMLPWHLWQLWVHGHLFFHEYVSVNLIGRMSRLIEIDPLPPYYYLDMLRRGFSIWGYLWPLAYLWGVWRALKQGDRATWLLLTWITIPLVLFSIAQTKQGWYINVIYPGIALLVGLALADLLTDRVALAAIAVIMAVCCIRLPMAIEGAPGIKPFVPHVAQYVAVGDPLYVFEEICTPRGLTQPPGTLLQPGQNVQPSLRFYLDRALICLEGRDLEEGVHVPHAYVISHRKFLPRVSNLGPVVFEGDTYVLVQWQ